MSCCHRTAHSWVPHGAPQTGVPSTPHPCEYHTPPVKVLSGKLKVFNVAQEGCKMLEEIHVKIYMNLEWGRDP